MVARGRAPHQEPGLLPLLRVVLRLAIAHYYGVRRGIPAENVVQVRLPVRGEVAPLEIASAKRVVDTRLPRGSAYLLGTSDADRNARQLSYASESLLPAGAVADHLTSSGDVPAGVRQMSALRRIEACWKSLAMPSEGVFIGGPLAAPFRGAP